jgi:hypothetical protein
LARVLAFRTAAVKNDDFNVGGTVALASAAAASAQTVGGTTCSHNIYGIIAANSGIATRTRGGLRYAVRAGAERVNPANRGLGRKARKVMRFAVRAGAERFN